MLLLNYVCSFSTQNICYSNIMSFWLLQQQQQLSPRKIQIKLFPLVMYVTVFLGNRTKRHISKKRKRKKHIFFRFVLVHIGGLVSFILFVMIRDCCSKRKMCHILAIYVKLLQQTEHRSEMNSQVFMRLFVGTHTKIQTEHILQFLFSFY